MKVVSVKLKNKVPEGSNIMTFKFRIPEDLTWTEGTHLHMAFNDFFQGPVPDKSKVRALSVISSPKENYIGISTRILENGSDFKRRLLQLEPEDEMLFFKMGNRMELRRSKRPIVMISMGVGMATFRPLILKFHEDSEGIEELINLNVDSGKNNLYKEEIEGLNITDFSNHYLNSRKALYETIDKYLVKTMALYYVVGSDQFLKDICHYLIESKVAAEDIVMDKKQEKRAEIIDE